MQTSRFAVALALVAAGCGYQMPSDDPSFRVACYSQQSCPSGWKCGSVWTDASYCSDPSRGSANDGEIAMSDGSLHWGHGLNEPNIPFWCAPGLNLAVGMYCYQGAPTCGAAPCSASQKCGYANNTTTLSCWETSYFVSQGDCGNCVAPARCLIIFDPGDNGMSIPVCSNQP